MLSSGLSESFLKTGNFLLSILSRLLYNCPVQSLKGDKNYAKKQPGFVLKKIKDSYYLLPFGQQVADQKKGLFLNETGAFLWECLCDTTKHAELVKKLAGHYQLEESDFPDA